MYKYIGAALGFFFSGFHFIGAIAGGVLGALIDSLSIETHSNNGQGSYQRKNPYHNYSQQDIFNYYRQQAQRYDFPTMLLALSAVVMKADGIALKVELEYVKSFLRVQFGNQFNQRHLHTLKFFIDNPSQIPLQEICMDIRRRTQPEVRVQLLHYLFGIAKADGKVSPQEIRVLNQIAQLLGIPNMDFTSVENMFKKDAESDYKILGISKNASDDEVKKAYRQMAVRYHPDKVAQMGEDFQKGAKEKFQEIQNAYENIKKARGIK
ncbi:MAG: TerB family tellurite resistance protein [Brumimicrobium sp.]|nr:TerB family tellurite resistance protein [Brumimicrobium sp.]MCO5268313.1 TerB family tellurite resistance protein [Brumimicrobium sp.]